MFRRLSLACTLIALAPAACDGCVAEPPAEGEGEPAPVDAGPAEGEGEGEGEPDADPDDPDNDVRDTDCDAISDEDEFGDQWPGGLTTDPEVADSDADGIPDGVESGASAAVDATACPSTALDADPTTTTNPTLADSDGDCRDDGEEDRNHNGSVDAGEGDPGSTDSDLDGLDDSAEDLDCDGVLDAGETDAADGDSDDDGLSDGFEVLIGSNPLDDDSDDDGIPDGQEVENGDDPIGDLADADGDGVSDESELANGTDPADADSDDDGLCDGNRDVAAAPCVAGEDRDGDGLLDPGESSPLSADTDCDGLSDRDELTLGADALDPDTDGDGLSDGVEGGSAGSADPSCSAVSADTDPSTTTSPTAVDSDGDGLRDGVEDLDHDGALDVANPGGAQETDATDADTDSDGLCDGPQTVAAASCVTGEDRNGDGVTSGTETDPRVPDTDTDHDGIIDLREVALGLDANDPDVDNDGLCDGAGSVAGVCAAGEDLDADGVLDLGETNAREPDTDCDGLSDGAEIAASTFPRDPDTDNDGLSDGLESSRATPVPGTACVGVVLDTIDATAATSSDPLYSDTDQDGIPDGSEDRNHDGAIAAAGVSPRETFPRDPDSDDDGRCDGTGRVAGVCVPGEDFDADGIVDVGETDPRVPEIDVDGDGLLSSIEALLGTSDSDADSDDDGLCDGSIAVAAASCVAGEDRNRNGAINTGETNPNLKDSDCDALSDGQEHTLGTDPLDADTDNDLLTDGVERSVSAVLDCPTAPVVVAAGAVQTDPLDIDTDNDGLNDGSEDRDRDGHLDAPVANPRTTLQETNPTVADTDGDGLCDGPVSVGACSAGEDLNRNGIVDGGETDPRVANQDLDDDGLDDADEVAIYGTDPADDDSDNDGLLDGEEVQQTNTDPNLADADCDGLNDGDEQLAGTDPLDADSDADGLTDGLESGTTCSTASNPPETDAACNVAPARCVADANGATTTNPLDPDSDNDGIEDGAEDANQNGAVDAGELNPNDVSDVSGADANACSAANLRAVTLAERSATSADLTVALAPTFSDTVLSDGGGQRGALFFDATKQVAGAAFTATVAGADPAAKLLTLEAIFETRGDISAGTTERRTFTTWDGFDGAIGEYQWSDSQAGDVVTTSLLDLVTGIAPGASSTPAFFAGTDTGLYKLQVEVVVRPDRTVVVLGLARNARLVADERALFRLDDHTNGSNLATFDDDTGTQCDRFTVQPAQRVDFLVVVDNSGSMSNEQTGVARAASEISRQLSASTVDWRVALATSNIDYVGSTQANWDAVDVRTTNTPRYCEFTTSPFAIQRCVRLNLNGDGDISDTVTQPFNEVTIGLDLNGDGDATDTAVASVSESVVGVDINRNGNTTDSITSITESGMGTGGSGAENFFRPTACLLGQLVPSNGVTTGTGINSESGEMCGRNQQRPPYSGASTYQSPPSTFVLLPRASNDTRKLRTSAGLVVIYITDANEQSDAQFPNNDSLPTWEAFFNNYDQAGSAAFTAGITCPPGTDCTDGDGAVTTRFQVLCADRGGVARALPPDTDVDQAQKIADAVRAILDASIAQASPYVLTKPPISSTIKVAINAEVFDPVGCEASCEAACEADGGTAPACDTQCECSATGCTDLPRSKSDGFDYDGTTNSLQFYGDCRPRFDQVGERIAVSYRYWIPDLVDGDECNCGLGPPWTCVNDTCVCPADCGLGEPLPAGRTCNPTTCALECLPDCGGCVGASECQLGSCACECPAGCGGPSPGPGFTCDDSGPDATCEWTCEACPGTAPSAFSVCDFDTCQWTCPGCTGQAPAGTVCNVAVDVCDFTCAADCGGACDGSFSCNTTLCQCECPSDCGAPPPGAGYTCNPQSCEYECPSPLPGVNPPTSSPGFEWDAAACGWTCNESTCDGSAAPGPEALCDPTTCTWRCPADCGGCSGASTCNSTQCACVCPAGCGSPAPGANFVCDDVVDCAWECPATPPTPPPDENPWVWDLTTCSWQCPADCGTGGLPANQQCDRSTCTTECRADCGGCGANEHCDTGACDCVCDENVSCAAGFVYDPVACQCVCDLNQACAATRVLDPETCSCECHEDASGDPDCNGCGAGLRCQPSLCECVPLGG